MFEKHKKFWISVLFVLVIPFIVFFVAWRIGGREWSFPLAVLLGWVTSALSELILERHDLCWYFRFERVVPKEGDVVVKKNKNMWSYLFWVK